MSKIVVIDDEVVLRTTFRHILKEAGFDVWVAENGREGVETCRQVEPDLVVVDLLMPEMDGFTSISQLRSRFPALPIVAISGVADVYGKEHSLRCGATTFIPKPIDGAAMIALANELLRENGAEAHNRPDTTNTFADGREKE